LPIDDVERLREDLHNDYILTNELKTITGGLATTCGKFMAIASLGITTLRHMRQTPEKKQMNGQRTINNLRQNFTMYFAKNFAKNNK